MCNTKKTSLGYFISHVVQKPLASNVVGETIVEKVRVLLRQSIGNSELQTTVFVVLLTGGKK